MTSERQLDACFKKGVMVPTIMLTCGTTDTFAIDDISSVRQTTERLCRKYHIPRSPSHSCRCGGGMEYTLLS